MSASKIAPQRFAVLGDPIAHSKSPGMHAAAYRAQKLPHTYEAVRANARELADRVRELREGVFGGLNVTVPHKRRVLEHVDEVHVTARIAGAANTLVRTAEGRIVAYNTDAPALADELRTLAPEIAADAWRHQTALVIGSGGAARSAIVALGVDLAVARIVVRVRPRPDGIGADGAASGDDRGRAFEFASEMRALLEGAGSATRVEASPYGASAEIERDVAAIAQATSAGMTGAEPGEGVADVVAWGELSPRAIALDVVYAPPETPFLRAAREHGIRAANGIGMLARQGALAYQLWLGGSLPYNAMLTALL